MIEDEGSIAENMKCMKEVNFQKAQIGVSYDTVNISEEISSQEEIPITGSRQMVTPRSIQKQTDIPQSLESSDKIIKNFVSSLKKMTKVVEVNIYCSRLVPIYLDNDSELRQLNLQQRHVIASELQGFHEGI